MKTLTLSAICLAFCSAASAAEPIPAGKPVEFSEKVFKAWKDAGAQPGWMRLQERGHTGFLHQSRAPSAGTSSTVRYVPRPDRP